MVEVVLEEIAPGGAGEQRAAGRGAGTGLWPYWG